MIVSIISFIEIVHVHLSHAKFFVDCLGLQIVLVGIQSDAFDVSLFLCIFNHVGVECSEDSLAPRFWHHIHRLNPMNNTAKSWAHLVCHCSSSHWFLILVVSNEIVSEFWIFDNLDSRLQSNFLV